MSRWTPVLDVLDTPGPIVVTAHINPDGDALGSELALAAWLEARGRDVRIVNADAAGPRYAFLDPAGRCETYDPARHDACLAGAAVAVILDVCRWDRLGAVGEALARGRARRVCIDHHVAEAPVPVEAQLIDTTAAATGELIYDLVTGTGGTIDAGMALALYVALMTDTGSFRYANTTPRTHAIAGELLRHPIDTAAVYDTIYGQSSGPRLRVMGEALQALDVRGEGAVVLLTVTAAALARLGATPADTEGLAELGRTLEGCRAAASFVEQADGRIKVSLRSRGTLDVARVAGPLGGGGHAGAAGILLPGPLPEARERVAEALVRAAALVMAPKGAGA